MKFGMWGRLLVTAAALGLATGALAQGAGEVMLKSLDGFTQLRGELVEFDGKTYTLRTGLGTLRIDALQVKCEGEICPKDVLFGAEFGVAGSNTIGAELMPSLIQGYADTLEAELVREQGANGDEMLRIIHPDGREMAAIDLTAKGSGTAFDALANGQAALGMASRRARGGDLEKLEAAGFADPRDTPNEHVIALDGIVAVVHPSNPLRSISMADLAGVFSGRITNWSELGGPNLPIKVYSREAGSGTRDTFDSLVLDAAGVGLRPDAQTMASSIEISDNVASDPGAIGYTALASVRASKPLGIRQSCGMLAIPSVFAMKTEEYPLSRRLYLYETDADKPAHAAHLLEYAASPEAQALIQDAGFVNTAPEAIGLQELGARIVYSLTTDDEFSLPAMRQMLTELQDAERLSTTFRFTPGSSQLDPLSQREASLLAERIASGDYEGKEILLVGFTDAIGQFELNRELANRRAEVVLQSIRNAGGPGALNSVAISTRGYGELMPVGCNQSFGGRLANRRVEVWLRDITS